MHSHCWQRHSVIPEVAKASHQTCFACCICKDARALKDDEGEAVETKCIRCLKPIEHYIQVVHTCHIQIGGIYDVRLYLCELCRLPVIEAVKGSLLALKGDDGRLKQCEKRSILV